MSLSILTFKLDGSKGLPKILRVADSTLGLIWPSSAYSGSILKNLEIKSMWNLASEMFLSEGFVLNAPICWSKY